MDHAGILKISYKILNRIFLLPITMSYIGPCLFLSYIYFTTSLIRADDVNCKRCFGKIGIPCYSGGVCCYSGNDDEPHCICPKNHHGNNCEEHHEESKIDSKYTLTLLSSLFGLLATFLVLIALALIIWYLSKKSKEKRRKLDEAAQSLGEDFLSVQKELETLPVHEQIQRLTRLSLLIEATTRAALITYPGIVSSTDGSQKRKSIVSFSGKSSFRRFSAPKILDSVPEAEERLISIEQGNRESIRFTSLK